MTRPSSERTFMSTPSDAREWCGINGVLEQINHGLSRGVPVVKVTPSRMVKAHVVSSTRSTQWRTTARRCCRIKHNEGLGGGPARV